MPHKRNPIGCEQIVGMARLVRANAGAAFENNALWHERDISHSSVERVIHPTASSRWITCCGGLRGSSAAWSSIRANAGEPRAVARCGVFRHRPARTGAARRRASRRTNGTGAAQRDACVSSSGRSDLLLADGNVTKVLPAQEIERAFDLDDQLKHVDVIFDRVFVQQEFTPDACARVRHTRSVCFRPPGHNRRRGPARTLGVRERERRSRPRKASSSTSTRPARGSRARGGRGCCKLLANPVMKATASRWTRKRMRRWCDEVCRRRLSRIG